jgi:predicted ATPase
LLFEDLHRIDSESQALLDGLIESLPTARVLLLITYRPEYEHAWGSNTYYTELRIDPLPPESAEELLTALLGQDGTLAPLKHVLIERAQGNPFFLEESVQTLVETGVLVGDRGGLSYDWGAGGVADPGDGSGDRRRAYRSAATRRQATASGCLHHWKRCAVHAPAGHRRRA